MPPAGAPPGYSKVANVCASTPDSVILARAVTLAVSGGPRIIEIHRAG